MKVYTTNERRKAKISTKPGVGFLGLGLIGKHRLEALKKSQFAEVVSICDPFADDVTRYCQRNDFVYTESYDALLDQDIEGVVIATPSAMHSDQVLMALEKGKAVFCQQPLTCDLFSSATLIDLAKRKDLLLMTDYSYRYTEALREIRRRIEDGELGDIFNVRATFHSAYQPEKKWYYQKELSGGGCVMDLGVHLIDMIYWIFPDLLIRNITADLFTHGRPLLKSESAVEDYAMVHMKFVQDFTAELACSWNAHLGRDAVINVEFTGTKGGACFRNVQGSFYDFKAELFHHTKRHVVSLPPDDWGGRAAREWASLLQDNPHYQEETELYLKTAETIDLIYGH